MSHRSAFLTRHAAPILCHAKPRHLGSANMRLFWTRALAIACVSFCATSSAFAQPAGPTRQQQKELICGPGDSLGSEAQPATHIKTPRVLLREDGTAELHEPGLLQKVTLAKTERQALSFCYAIEGDCTPGPPDKNSKLVLIRVDRVSPRGERKVICQEIAVGTTYFYPLTLNDPAVRQGDILNWAVFASAEAPADPAAATNFPARAAHKKVLEAAIVKEAPQRILHLIFPKFARDAKDYVARVGSKPSAPVDPVAMRDARDAWACPGAANPKRSANEHGFASSAICNQLDAFEKAANSLSRAVPPKSDDRLNYAAILALMGEVPDETAFCEKIAKHRWVNDAESFVRRAAFALPFSWDVDQIQQVSFDSGKSVSQTVDPDTQPLLVLADVPANQGSLKFQSQFEAASTKDGGVVLAQFALNIASFAMGKGLLPANTVLTSSMLKAMPDNQRPPTDGFLCRMASKFDPDLQTRAKVGTRAARISENLGERKLILKVCSGSTCDEPKDDKPGTITNTVLFEARRGWAPFIMAGLGASAMEGRYRIEQVSSGNGPDDIYELTRDTMDLTPSVDLLLGLPLPLCRHAALFVGPALVAKSYDLLHLWKAGLALRQPRFSKYVYILIHVTAGWRDEVRDPKANQRWALPSDAKAPVLATEQRVIWGAGVSLGIDLDLLGSATDDVLKKITGDSK